LVLVGVLVAEMAAAFSVNDEGWPLSPEGYEIIQQVGEGAFAKVLKAFCPSKGAHVAVKVMALENITTSLEEIQAEVKTMKLARHENVLDLFCCFVVRSDLWLIMPLMDKGSCYYCLRSLRKAGLIGEGQGFTEEAIATVMKETLQGLDYIHSHGQIHRDIKAGNILLNSEGRVAIADFGVAGWMTESGDRSTKGPCKTFVGTPCWMAPEVMEQSRGYNEKADIWSVGITALELYKGYAPYAKFPPMQVLIKTIREPAPTLKVYADEPGKPGGSASAAASERFQKFVARCLQKDPRDRPSAHELLSDPFIKRAASKTSKLPEMFLKDVPEVGSSAADVKAAAEAARAPFEGDAGASLVPGTTWVFPEDVKAALKAPGGWEGSLPSVPEDAGGEAAGADGGANVNAKAGVGGEGGGVMSKEALEDLLEGCLEDLGGEGHVEGQ
jgi:serine/threonine-protein kinase OSR1/STK39